MNYRSVVNTVRHFKVNLVIKILILSDFIILTSSNLLSPIFAIFIAEQVPGGDIESAGVAVAIYAVAKAVSEVPVGVFIDKHKGELDDLYVTFIGTIMQGIVYITFIFISNIWQLFLLQALLGVASAVAYPGWYAIFTRHVDSNKQGFEWSLYDVLMGFGYAGAAALSGFIAVRWGFSAIFSVVGIMTICGSSLLVLIRNKMRLVKP
ncbi:TPA: hypothetical protein DF272_02610 [Candidatus Falkowbacteria bacterium]|nr:hypothetical protein [Candidatus Falkowbacteria bacterium]